MRPTFTAMLSAALLLCGCRTRERSPQWAEVAPVLERACVRCHASDAVQPSVAPALDTYASAALNADAIAESVRRRDMPPWGPDATGVCGTFRDSPWLSAEDIERLTRWARAGAPRGPEVGERTRAREVELPNGDGSLVLDARLDFEPRVGAGAYRCFLLDAPNDADTHVLAAHSPRGALPVDQIAAWALDADADVASARALDARDEAAGWSCASGVELPSSRLVAAWSSVTPAVRMPSGAGTLLRAHQTVVVQVHVDLTSSGAEQAVRPQLVLSTGAAETLRFLEVRARDFSIAPGLREAEVAGEAAIDAPLQLLGLVPRMRTLGRTLKVERLRAGERTCLAYFGHWNPYTAELFAFAAPVELAPGDRVRVSCTFSTTGRTEPVHDGTREEDETCLALLSVAPASAPQKSAAAPVNAAPAAP